MYEYVKNKRSEVKKTKKPYVYPADARVSCAPAGNPTDDGELQATSTEIPLARPVNALPLAPECPPHLDPYVNPALAPPLRTARASAFSRNLEVKKVRSQLSH